MAISGAEKAEHVGSQVLQDKVQKRLCRTLAEEGEEKEEEFAGSGPGVPGTLPPHCSLLTAGHH